MSTLVLRSKLAGSEARVPLSAARRASRFLERLLDTDAGNGPETELHLDGELDDRELGYLVELLALGAGAEAEIAALDAILRTGSAEADPDEIRRVGADAVLAYAERVPRAPCPLGAESLVRVAATADRLEATTALWVSVAALCPLVDGRSGEALRAILEGTPEGLLYDLFSVSKQRETMDEIMAICGLKKMPDEVVSRGAAAARDLCPLFSRLNASQRVAVRKALVGDNVFVTGAGGTGKSFVLEAIVDGIPRFDGALGVRDPRKRVVVAAPTAAAAQNVGGVTIHSHFGINPEHPSSEDVEDTLGRRWNRHGRDKEVLAMDEFSMIHPDLLDIVESGLAGAVAAYTEGDIRPFGGQQIVLFGDLLQLPPVDKTRGPDGQPRIASDAEAFRLGGFNRPENVVILRESVRHAGSDAYDQALSEIRLGLVSDKGASLLASRVGKTPPADGIVATRILFSNKAVGEENDAELARLPAETEVVYRCEDWWDPFAFGGDDEEGSSPRAIFANRCRAAERIALRRGAQVVFNANRTLPLHPEVVNGTRGVVVRLEKGGVYVRVEGGRELYVPPHTYNVVSRVEYVAEPCWRHGGRDCPCETSIRRVNVPTATRKQLPLSLAWAATVHRSQGQTLDRAVVSIGSSDWFRENVPGGLYVALSRVRGADSLFLDSFDPSMVRAHARALEFYRSLGGSEGSARPAPKCRCPLPEYAVYRVTKNGPNTGRVYTACPRRRCGYWSWVTGAKRPRE